MPSRFDRKKKASVRTLISTTCTPEPLVSTYIAHICIKQVFTGHLTIMPLCTGFGKFYGRKLWDSRLRCTRTVHLVPLLQCVYKQGPD